MDYLEQAGQYSDLTAQAGQQPAMDPIATAVFFIFYFAVLIVLITAGWKIFTKAKKPGWAIFIPFYNTIVMLEIIKRPVWWLLLFFVPFVNIIIAFIVAMDLAKAFGRSVAFGIILLFFFSPIGILILAFGKSKYVYGNLEAVQNSTPPVTPPASTPPVTAPPAATAPPTPTV